MTVEEMQAQRTLVLAQMAATLEAGDRSHPTVCISDEPQVSPEFYAKRALALMTAVEKCTQIVQTPEPATESIQWITMPAREFFSLPIGAPVLMRDEHRRVYFAGTIAERFRLPGGLWSITVNFKVNDDAAEGMTRATFSEDRAIRTGWAIDNDARFVAVERAKEWNSAIVV